jgi:hypothetical protein
MQIMINRHYYQVWRKRGETATSAARLAKGSQAIADGKIIVSEESDGMSCQCDYDGWRCSECKDYRRRNHEDLKQVNRRHKCQCRYTLCFVAKSADGEYCTSLGGVCVDSLDDSYLEYVAADLACELLHEMRPTPEHWMAL